MPRYIDADALISKIAYHRDGLDHNNVTAVSVLNNVIEIIERRPTVSPDDARGVGKWIPLDYSDEAYGNMYKCAKCGCSEIGEPNYCPNCGARMGGVQDALS